MRDAVLSTDFQVFSECVKTELKHHCVAFKRMQLEIWSEVWVFKRATENLFLIIPTIGSKA